MSEDPFVTPKKEPGTGVKILLGVLTVLLCICLCASLLATALIVDMRLVTSEKSIENMVNSLLSAPTQSYRHLPVTAAVGGLQTGQTDDLSQQTTEALAAWLYDTLKAQYGDEIAIFEEQMLSFVEKSTLKEYLSQKTVSYIMDFINGTQNTAITAEELYRLVEENAALIESEFGIRISPEVSETIVRFLAEANIDQVIHTEIMERIENTPISGSGEADACTVGGLMADLRTLTSTTALVTCIVMNLVLMAALFFTNRMRLPGTLVSVGVPMTVMGLLMSVPVALLQLSGDLITETAGALAAGAIRVMVGTIAPVHYVLLALGIVLIAGSIAAKVILKKKSSG